MHVQNGGDVVEENVFVQGKHLRVHIKQKR